VTTTLEQQEHPVPAQRPAREKEWRVGRALLLLGVAGLAVGAVVFGGRTVTLNDEKTDAQNQASAQGQAKDNVAERAIAVCKGATPDELQKLNAVGLCVAAADAKNQPVPTTAAPVPFATVKAAVDAYFAAHPVQAGPPPSDQVVLGFVRQVYEANKPADGKTPSDAELLLLIRQVYAANPPADGKDGQNAHCFDVPADPACQPKKGDQGAQGVSVQAIDLDSSDGGCELVVTFFNPADGTTTQDRKPVNPALCGPAAPPSTTTVTETASENPPLPIPSS
jgi:hypothetical protein